MAMLTGTPMHSMGAGIAEHLSALGAAREFGSIALLARASQKTLAAMSSDVAGHLEDIHAARESSPRMWHSCRGARIGSPRTSSL